jgi:hypothetical protein
MAGTRVARVLERHASTFENGIDMSRMKLALWVLLAAVLVFAAGWLWGASGRRAAEAGERDARLRLHAAQARGALLAARVDVFERNFGQASRNFERAKASLGEMAAALEKAGRSAEATAVGNALARSVKAQQLAGAVDQAANSEAAEALRILEGAGVER